MTEGSPDRVGRLLARSALGLWLLITILLSANAILDPDFAFHVAWGRFLLEDFGGARLETWGQAPGVLRYAYSYWLYQVAAAWTFDQLGPTAVVLGRSAVVIALAISGVALARRMGASWLGCAIGLVLFTTISHERFVDRPDVISHLFWLGALWILLRHIRDRGVWLLVPLQILWANTHVYFGLLPALTLAIAGAVWIESRVERGHTRVPRWRGVPIPVLMIPILIAAATLTPAGIGSWTSQLAIARFLTGDSPLPIPIQEMLSPYAPDEPFFALWVFRIAMPVSLLAAFWARRRIGLPAVIAILVAAILGASARRAMSLFGCTALVVMPLVWGAWEARLGDRARTLRVLTAGGLVVAGLLVLAGLGNGRIFLAQDKNMRLGDFGPPRYAVAPAARFLHEHQVAGPLFHNPASAGPILLENGSRLAPFLDARWLGTAETIAIYQRLREIDERSAPLAWQETCDARDFQCVVLDFYEMPVLLRLLWRLPDWAPVFFDEGAAVFVRRRGPSAQLVREFERGTRARVVTIDPEVPARLAEATRRFLQSEPPPLWRRLEFPYDAFYRANFALQIRERGAAQAAYLELLENERGALWVNRHRTDILGNLLWCLPPEETPVGIELCSALRQEPSLSAQQRFGLLYQELTARSAHGGGDPLIGKLAQEVARHSLASPDQRQWAWSQLAALREREEDWEGMVEALNFASAANPATAQIWRSLGLVLDLRLARRAEAVSAYQRFQELGGVDSLVAARLRELR